MRFANGQYITTNPYKDTLELTKEVKQKAEKLINIAMALQLQISEKEEIHFGTVEEPFSEMTYILEELAGLIGWDENALINDILCVLQP